ncbi:MAG: ABC transporter ATP-binding protein [Candidatus Schekmanbacteria bacterium]|nr:MAG: ABC transporter ATP-binding protein [Candidatus Schekmanbacteria bacterium]
MSFGKENFNEAVIKLRKISRDFSDGRIVRRVLDDINLDIFKGELTIIAGPSGSGKTTLLSIMGLILTPTEGKLFFEEKEIVKLSDRRRAKLRRKNYGFVFQQAELIPSLTLLENVLIANGINGTPIKKETRERAKELLINFGLEEYINSPAAKISSGQKQRVAIARALINSPKLLLCDEPTSALDSESSKVVLETLKKLSRDKERGVVLITHDPRVFPYGDRLIKMVDGKIDYDSKSENEREVAVYEKSI